MGKETISISVLPLENRIMQLKRFDLYNKSRMSREVQVRFSRHTALPIQVATDENHIANAKTD